MQMIPQPKRRQCGSCSLCCRLIAVEALNKPQNQWCPSFRPGVGCAIWAHCSDECRQWDCAWLRGLLPKELSPRRTRCVVFPAGEKTIRIEQDADGLADSYFHGPIEQWINAGFTVEIAYKGQGMRYERKPAC